jgi:hypothetical protein
LASASQDRRLGVSIDPRDDGDREGRRERRVRARQRILLQRRSAGGRQALSEAQRFPPYDGIVAGPGSSRINLIYGSCGRGSRRDADGAPVLRRETAGSPRAVAACDRNDGLEDSLIGDPP